MNNEKLELAKKWQRQGYTKDNAETELIDFAEMDPSAAKATVNKVFEAVLKEHKDAYGDETKDLDKKATKRIQ
jgi:CRISPR/Cas system-associated protein Csm6